MSLSALFYFNGILEGAASVVAYYEPDTFTGGEQVKGQSKMYAHRFALVLGSFSISSILMANQPDSPSKQIYALGWFLFHTGIVIERSLRDIKVASILIHGGLSIAFLYYLYKSDFQKETIIPRIIFRKTDQISMSN